MVPDFLNPDSWYHLNPWATEDKDQEKVCKSLSRNPETLATRLYNFHGNVSTDRCRRACAQWVKIMHHHLRYPDPSLILTFSFWCSTNRHQPPDWYQTSNKQHLVDVCSNMAATRSVRKHCHLFGPHLRVQKQSQTRRYCTHRVFCTMAKLPNWCWRWYQRDYKMQRQRTNTTDTAL